MEAWRGEGPLLSGLGGGARGPCPALSRPIRRYRSFWIPIYHLCSKPGSLDASRVDARRLAWPAWPGLAGLLAGWLSDLLDWRIGGYELESDTLDALKRSAD